MSNLIKSTGSRTLRSKSIGKMPIFILLIITGLISACENKNDSAEVHVGPARPGLTGGPTGEQLAAAGVLLNGIVYAQEDEQDLFLDALRGFLSAWIPEEYVGFVSARAEYNTGVLIGGRVAMSSGTLRNVVSGGQQVSITSNSQLRMDIYDEHTTSVEMIIPVYLPNSSGQVSGNSAKLQFWDARSKVELTGQFDESVFYGIIRYQNNRYHDNTSSNEYGTLGNFEIPTCEFFVCD